MSNRIAWISISLAILLILAGCTQPAQFTSPAATPAPTTPIPTPAPLSSGAREVAAASAPPSFIVDRPFFFAIWDRHTGAVLFMGVALDPEAL
jgi:hypothetical protein